ncbi:hypothetical protein J2Z23_003449 [Lederbergia galactosidilyticus]|nr:hypothetical protein [Lederbergia galactosidilytica]
MYKDGAIPKVENRQKDSLVTGLQDLRHTTLLAIFVEFIP